MEMGRGDKARNASDDAVCCKDEYSSSSSPETQDFSPDREGFCTLLKLSMNLAKITPNRAKITHSNLNIVESTVSKDSFNGGAIESKIRVEKGGGLQWM
ncbi:hypothetical protein AVEN_236235-1 [Araneus ventricosus]|uniref:Uncharacterized protein n=1 Tax=Araneus ventricosus TaxID=182803 RepID=A0A4Y2CAY3_ARAVE|nr:hypothetical protein AVEN_236235-1 [Araneus ventricosus]